MKYPLSCDGTLLFGHKCKLIQCCQEVVALGQSDIGATELHKQALAYRLVLYQSFVTMIYTQIYIYINMRVHKSANTDTTQNKIRLLKNTRKCKTLGGQGQLFLFTQKHTQ